MRQHQTIPADQLRSLYRAQARNTQPHRLVAPALRLIRVFVNSSLVPQLLLVALWVSSFVLQPREPVEGRAKVMTKNYKSNGPQVHLLLQGVTGE
jgi:hypothetical protein